MKKLKTGDEVIVISGKDKGKIGTLSNFLSENKCVVSGVKIVKKHQKPNPQLNIQGGIIEKESPIELSNVAIYNKKTKKGDKVRIEIKNDKKIRVFKSDGKEIKWALQYPIGCKVTLRGERMFAFLDRLISIAIPRERDFRGLSPKAFDGQGNYSLGIKEHIIFPEIDYDKVQKIRGLDISITTSAHNDEEGLLLLKELNFPFISWGKNGQKINDS